MANASMKQVGYVCVLLRQKGIDPKKRISENAYGIPEGATPDEWLPEQDGETVSEIIDALK